MGDFIYRIFLLPIRNFIVSILKKRQQIQLQNAWRKKYREHTKYRLSKEEKARAKAFYKPYHKISVLFHSFYKEKTGQFFAEYIPDDLYYCYIDHYYNNWDTAPTIDNKCFYEKIFPGMLQPTNMAKRVNNIWFNDKNELITEEEAFNVISTQEAFVKYATFSEGGHGVFFVDCKEKAEHLWGEIKDTNRDIVIQKPICQHEKLAAFNSSSVNTIRVLSLLTDNYVKVYSSVLRMGIDGSKVDNASSGGITCGVTLNGKLRKFAYTSSGEKFTFHPNSKIEFENYELPSYDRILEMVKSLQLCTPNFRMVSWDFAVRDDGEPILIEANLRYGELDFHQLNNGPLFGEDTIKILDEVFGRK